MHRRERQLPNCLRMRGAARKLSAALSYNNSCEEERNGCEVPHMPLFGCVHFSLPHRSSTVSAMWHTKCWLERVTEPKGSSMMRIQITRERESLPQYCFARQQRRRCDVAGVTRWNCEQIVWLKKKRKVQTINWNKDVLATHVALATPKPMNRKLFGNWLFLFVSKSLVCTRHNVIWKCCLNPAE